MSTFRFTLSKLTQVIEYQHYLECQHLVLLPIN